MLRLVMGGCAQGKLEYVLSRYQLKEEMVFDGYLPSEELPQRKTAVVDHFHRWVRTEILEGRCPEEEIRAFLERCEDCIIISDEIGNGIVPLEPLEREIRERTGRILTGLAKEAKEVYRVLCGIGQRIK